MTSKKKGTARRTGPLHFPSRTRTTKDVPPIKKLLGDLGLGDDADKQLLNEFNTARKIHMNRFLDEKILDDKDILDWADEQCRQKLRRLAKNFLVRHNHGPHFWPDEVSPANAKNYRYPQDSQQLIKTLTMLFFRQLYHRRSHNIKVRKDKRRNNLFERGDAPDEPIALDLSSDESDYEYQIYEAPESPMSGDSVLLKREPADSPDLPSIEEIRRTVQTHTMPSDTATSLPSAVQNENVNPETADKSGQPSRTSPVRATKRPLLEPDASSLRAKSPRLNAFRAPTADPFSRDANVRLESVARAVSPRQDLRRSSRKSVPAPVASMGEGSGTNATQELPSEAERNSTDEIVCGFKTAIREVQPTGEDSSSSARITEDETETTATDQPVKLGSAPLSQKETPATSDPDIEELSSSYYDTAAARRLLSSHLRGHATNTPTPLQFSFSFHDGSHGDPFSISAIEFFTMTLRQFMDVLPLNDKEMIIGLCIRQYGPKFCLRQVYLYNEAVFGNIRQQFLRCIESDTRDVKNHGKRLDYEISIEPLRDFPHKSPASTSELINDDTSPRDISNMLHDALAPR
ncbi:hypothetical protein FCIRC_8929 [Fusarium circinatum]|uniref:Uncharacterized protein n=1 Tax=Fusarium circinatum TaxID=48490 RepID=A0A8H5TDX3_FUSCI|nr:hypothetical protein FCIRC_8929 [Fusarium circinatum]